MGHCRRFKEHSKKKNGLKPTKNAGRTHCTIRVFSIPWVPAEETEKLTIVETEKLTISHRTNNTFLFLSWPLNRPSCTV